MGVVQQGRPLTRTNGVKMATEAKTKKDTLVSVVHVHPEDEESVTYYPGDDVPAAHKKLITNEKAWASDDEKAPRAASPYDQMSRDQLVASIETHNLTAEGKDKMSTKGSVPQLAQRLLERDAQQEKERNRALAPGERLPQEQS